MAEDQLNKSDEILDEIVTSPYKYGFTTDLETEEFEKGLNEDIIKKISLKKSYLMQRNMVIFFSRVRYTTDLAQYTTTHRME